MINLFQFLFLVPHEAYKLATQLADEARLCFGSGDYEGALDTSERANSLIEEPQWRLDQFDFQWQCQMRLGRLEAAQTMVNWYIEAWGQDPHVIASCACKRAIILNRQDKAHEAISAASRGLEQVGIHRHMRAQLYVELAKAHCRLFEFDEACSFLSSAGEVGTDLAMIRAQLQLVLAMIYNRQGKSDKAVSAAFSGLGYAEHSDLHLQVSLRLEVAWSYHIAEKGAQAIATLEDALNLNLVNEERARVYKYLGEFCEVNGQEEKAMTVWREGLDFSDVSHRQKLSVFNAIFRFLDKQKAYAQQEEFIRKALAELGTDELEDCAYTLVSCLVKQECLSKALDEIEVYRTRFLTRRHIKIRLITLKEEHRWSHAY